VAQTRWAVKGMYGLQNETAPIIAEYNARKRLAELGFIDDINNLDCITAECFLIISQEIDKLEVEKNRNK
jgi:hypothetical protein